MFVRKKARKNASGEVLEYAYLVRSKRRRKSKRPPKQKVLAYLGRVVYLKDYESSLKKDPKTVQEGVLSLLSSLLRANGFVKPKGQEHFVRGPVTVDFVKKQVFDAGTERPLCLAVNEGFITGPILSKIVNYKPIERNEREIGHDFAKKLVFSGIKPNKGDFLRICAILFKEISSGNKGVHQRSSTIINDHQRSSSMPNTQS